MKNTLKSFYRRYKKDYYLDKLLLKEIAYFKKSKKVLDIGCGEGYFLSLIRDKGIGIDTNKNSLLTCKKKNLKVVYANAVKIPFPNNSFDGIHCSHVIEHLYPDQAYKMLEDVGRVLKQNGIFVLSTPILWKGFYDDFTHIKPYSHRSIVRYLCENGSEKTKQDFKYSFKMLNLDWRYVPFLLPGKIGSFIANYLYIWHIHTPFKNGYTLVLKKL